MKTCFAHLKQLYDGERNAFAKLAPGLTFIVLHPNNMQCQNVHLALKVEKNISALTKFGKRFNCDITGTRVLSLLISMMHSGTGNVAQQLHNDNEIAVL